MNNVERGETDKDTGDHEGQAEEGGGAAVDRGGALRGIVGEGGREAGAAAEHPLLEIVGIGAGGGFGGEGDGHGFCLLPACLWQWGAAIGLCERGTLYNGTNNGNGRWCLHISVCNNMCEVIYGYQPGD
jgi:hypothetical protein